MRSFLKKNWHLDDAPAAHCDVAAEARRAGAVDDGPAPNDQIVHGMPSCVLP